MYRNNNNIMWLAVLATVLLGVLIASIVIGVQISNLGQTETPEETQTHLESQPTEGTEGTDPTAPSTPPSEPTQPSEPDDPTEPSQPTQPTEPVEPEPTWKEVSADRQMASQYAFV